MCPRSKNLECHVFVTTKMKILQGGPKNRQRQKMDFFAVPGIILIFSEPTRRAFLYASALNAAKKGGGNFEKIFMEKGYLGA